MSLTTKQIELISRLTSLTEEGKITWQKHNIPNSFIYKTSSANYIANQWKTVVLEMVSECCELAIEEGGTVTDDFVFCKDSNFLDDYKYLSTLYDTIKIKYTQYSDKEFDRHLGQLPT